MVLRNSASSKSEAAGCAADSAVAVAFSSLSRSEAVGLYPRRRRGVLPPPADARAALAASSPLIFPRTEELETQRLSNSIALISASSAKRLDDTSGASSSAMDSASYTRAKPVVCTRAGGTGRPFRLVEDRHEFNPRVPRAGSAA